MEFKPNILMIFSRFLWGLLILLYGQGVGSQENSFSSERMNQVQLIFDKRYDEIQFTSSRSNETTTPYNLLLVSEQEVVMLLKGEYDKLLLKIKEHEEKLFNRRNNRTYLIGRRFKVKPYEYAERSFSDEFNKALLNHLRFQVEEITNKINNSSLSEEDKQFLIYFMYLNIYYSDMCSSHLNQQALQKAYSFSKNYPSSKYLDFIKKYSSYEHSISDWGFDISIPSLGASVPLGGTGSEYFKPSWNYVGIGLGIHYKRMFLNYEISFLVSSVKKSIVDGYKHLSISFSGRSTRYYIGYPFYLNDNWTIAPILGFDNRRTLGVIELEENHEVKKLIYHDENALMAGLNIEYKFAGEDICEGDRAGGLYHRFQLGVSSINAPFGTKLISSKTFIIQYSIGCKAHFSRRLRALPDYMY